MGRKPNPKKIKYHTIGLVLNEKEEKDLVDATDKFNALVNVNMTKQKFLIKLLYDHKKRNS